MSLTVKIQDGTALFVYDDALVPLMDDIGASTVTRASYVEPHPDPLCVGWVADMHPVGGPVIGANGLHPDAPPIDHGWSGWFRVEPFRNRAAALAAERHWLQAHLGV